MIKEIHDELSRTQELIKGRASQAVMVVEPAGKVFTIMITDGLSGTWWNSLADICLPVNGASDVKSLFLIILMYCLLCILMRNSICKSLRCFGMRNSVPSNQ